jgi:hypothetical protein
VTVRAEILPRGCVCGHNHKTHRNEPINLCLESGCTCDEWTPRCQNCGEPVARISRHDGFDVCSRRCELQLEYATGATS